MGQYMVEIPPGCERVKLKHGRVSFGGSDRRSTPLKWFVWPADLNSLEAAIAGAVVGPFKTEAEAERAAGELEMFKTAPPASEKTESRDHSSDGGR